MAIVQSMASSFKREILLGEHDLETDEIKIALYTSAANLGPTTTEYATSGEVVGAGYTAGGEVMTGVTVSLSGTTAYVDFADTVWNPANFTARGALIYNASKSNKAIAVLDFGSDKTTTTTFTVQMPANTASSALIRIA
jgi:uncharacterized membrane-anchored protein